MSMRLPGSENANPILKEFILSLDDKKSDMTVDYTAYNFFDLDHPAVKWLQQCCNRAILDYATELGIDYSLEWTLQGWANINRLGDYHNLQSPALLAIWNLLRLFGQKKRRIDLISTRDDQHPPTKYECDQRSYPIYSSQWRVAIWPAFLHHLVHPNASEGRISVSFNVVLKWKPQYTPI